MHWRGPLLLAIGLATAACSGGADAPANNAATLEGAAAAGQVVDPEAVLTERWKRLFAAPDAVIAAANDFGYKAVANAGASAFAATGTEQKLPESGGPITVVTGFVAKGATKNRVDAVTFTFDVRKVGEVKRKSDAEAARIPDRIVTGFLGRFQLSPGPVVRAALKTGTTARTADHGGVIDVAATPLSGVKPGEGKHLVVTISPDSTASDSTVRN